MNVLNRVKIKNILAVFVVTALLLCGTGCEKIKNDVIDRIFDKNGTQTVRLTFPEGSTVAEIAEILEEGGVCTAEEFRNEANNAALLSDFGFEITNPQNRSFALEGYLFPDTYDFYVDEGANAAAKRFLENTQKKLDGNIRAQCEDIGYTLDEVLTIASIIQEEAGNPPEMGKVSSVLHNRLSDDRFPKLQCDAATFYLQNSVKLYVTAEKYNVLIEAYNTYDCEGLPEGPITNSGIDAVNAALNPENTTYYYFLTDSENVYHYSETYEEHLEKCSEAGLI